MDPIVEKLTTARVGLLLKAPFFGNMATRMRLIEADDWCPTAATNGRDFYYNTKFVQKLSVKKLEFLFGHEICHCVFDHFGRVGSRDRQLSNIAQDFAVNQKRRESEPKSTLPCNGRGLNSPLQKEHTYQNACGIRRMTSS